MALRRSPKLHLHVLEAYAGMRRGGAVPGGDVFKAGGREAFVGAELL